MLPLVSENDALVKEVESFRQFANVVDKETSHYIKHIVRGWCKEKQEEVMK